MVQLIINIIIVVFVTTVLPTKIQEGGCYLCKQTPPGPVTELEVGQTVSLNDTDGTQLLHTLLVVSASQSNRRAIKAHIGVRNG